MLAKFIQYCKLHKDQILTGFFLCFVFTFCTVTAATTSYNSAPDEAMKYDVCEYVYEHSALPHGGDESIRHEIWGISYAFTPAVSYAISGIFMKVMAVFHNTPFALLFAARLVSVFCITGYAFFCIKISKKLFKGNWRWLFVAFATLLPQLLYLGTYINNDSLALLSISIIFYAWILGLQDKWSYKSCITLAVGIGICALSYYNAFGFILTSVLIYAVSCRIFRLRFADFLKKGLMIAGIAILLAGWWYIRNAVIYNGDFLAMNIQHEYGELYALEPYKPSNRLTPHNTGFPFIKMLIWHYNGTSWVLSSIASFVGVFGFMNILMPAPYYIFYYCIGIVSAIGIIKFLIEFVKKRKPTSTAAKQKRSIEALFIATLILNIFIPIALSLYYSYFNDFQAQGRYIMPMLLPLVTLFIIGLQHLFARVPKEQLKSKIISILIAILFVSVASIFLGLLIGKV